VVTARKEPEYSDEARIAKLQGPVMVSVTIGEDGKPRDVRVVKPLGLGLDETAVAAVSDWLFTPGKKDGKPVEVQATIEVSFRMLEDARHWSLSGAHFTVPPGRRTASAHQSSAGSVGGSQRSGDRPGRFRY
jgi:TonB family protein